MKFSYSWLKDYVDGKLPDIEEVASILSTKSMEVEEIHGDILEVKVLPHRQHDCLSHRGLARELATLFDKKRNEVVFAEPKPKSKKEVVVTIEGESICTRYRAVQVDKVKVEASPAWIKERLEAIGQRSINNIVDITNFVMNDMGQPMHAFDADKVVGGISVRVAKKGETMTTLDGKELIMHGTETVIADDEGVLGLAGVKGGTKAIVNESTKSIIFEAATFNATRTRRASDLHGIRTDASKRFEAEISPSFVPEAMNEALALVEESLPDARIGVVVDVYKEEQTICSVEVQLSAINGLLGSSYTAKEAEDVFKRSHFMYEKKGDTYMITASPERLDIRIKEDIIEEVGRILGYDDLPVILPTLTRKGLPHKRLYYEMKIKNILLTSGFSEIYTYTFGNVGEVEIVKGLASDKEKLRTSLGLGVKDAIEMNLRNAPLLGIETVGVFEFGNVFTKEKETRHFALGMDDGKKKSLFNDQIDYALSAIKRDLGLSKIECEVISVKPYVIEVDFDTLISSLPEPGCAGGPSSYEPLLSTISSRAGTTLYKTVSAYPFIVRDIAVWTPFGTAWEDVHTLVSQVTNPLIVHTQLFDTFSKELEAKGKMTSYAFRLVLQSNERTLTDDEANTIATEVYELLKKQGYEIR